MRRDWLARLAGLSLAPSLSLFLVLLADCSPFFRVAVVTATVTARTVLRSGLPSGHARPRLLGVDADVVVQVRRGQNHVGVHDARERDRVLKLEPAGVTEKLRPSPHGNNQARR